MTLAKAILICLDRVSPMLLPEQSLWIDVNATLPRAVTITELRVSLQSLESSLAVASVSPVLDDRPKYFITDAGRALLRS